MVIDWPNHVTKTIESMADSPVVLYGAGKYGRQALTNIKEYFPELNVRFFVDDNLVRNRQAIYGVDVISLKNAMDLLGNSFHILITNYYVSDVLKKIEQDGFDLNKVHFCSELMIEGISANILKAHKQDLEAVYSMLGDYKSKVIYRTMLESRYTKNIDILCHTCDDNQYFPPKEIFSIGTEEVFIDAGAFDGDTIEQFLSFTEGNYKRIYAFEPDSTNYQKLKARGYGADIKIYNAGLYDTTGELSFSANKGGSSKVEINGESSIAVCAIDEFEDIDESVTFVKMDIEGSELSALKGMRGMIQKDKPKLAVCIYHKLEDLWELPLYIKNLVPEYRLYIRNYTTYLDEIVLYAVL